MVALFGPIGLPEMLIILAIVILIFGANRLPELGKGIGAGIKNFKSGDEGLATTSKPLPTGRGGRHRFVSSRAPDRDIRAAGSRTFSVTPYRSLNAATSTVARPPGAAAFSAATSAFNCCSASA